MKPQQIAYYLSGYITRKLERALKPIMMWLLDYTLRCYITRKLERALKLQPIGVC